MGMTNEEAMKRLKEARYSMQPFLYVDEAIDYAIKKLEQTRWIPVSERLPQDEQKVLVTTRSGNLIDVDTSIYHHASAYWEHYVIAWMPLPTVYQGE